MRLVVATRNAGKLREISRLLADTPYEVVGLSDLSGIPEVVEDGDSFAANAEKKARTVAELTGELTLADDSGLSVAALDGAPGIFSARYAGPQGDDAANNARLIAALRQVPDGQRQAAFVCAMALCWPQGECRIFHGRIDGEILHAPRGGGGFGYDPLFYVPTRQATMAELPLDVKNRISHRGQALGQVIRFLHSGDCPG